MNTLNCGHFGNGIIEWIAQYSRHAVKSWEMCRSFIRSESDQFGHPGNVEHYKLQSSVN